MSKTVSPETVAALEQGRVESATLAEILAVDLRRLWVNVFPEWADVGQGLPLDGGITKQMVAIATTIQSLSGTRQLPQLQTHPSDIVRGWAAYLVGQQDLPLAEQLVLIQPLADDPHFGVREWAWLALRPHIAADIRAAIDQLVPWVSHPSGRIRRFAVESTRPRGVWSAHIRELKDHPDWGLPLLEPLKADSERYVQDSVANWLNDASKTQPDWVQERCQLWCQTSDAKATQYIAKRATRSLKRS